jgi:site-specific DNA-methyltransferase (adenine-specific)
MALQLDFSQRPETILPQRDGRVLVRDAFELLDALDDESVDLVVTDPPYESLQLHRSRGTTTRLTSDWFTTIPNERLPQLVASVYRVLRPDRHFYLFCDEVTADVIKQQQGLGFDRQPNGARRCKSGLVYWKEIIWAKTTNDGGKIRGGTGYHYRASVERILFFEKGKRALNDLGIPDVLMAPRPQIRGPAAKPAAVLRTLIAQSSLPGEVVLDPFCGTGVAGVEARAAGRRFLLGDIDLAYLDPSLADVAPPGVARAQAIEVPAIAPPPLEKLAEDEDALDAAQAAGWIADGQPTPALRAMLEIRPVERRAAVRRALRELQAAPDESPLLRAWRSWALHGREE